MAKDDTKAQDAAATPAEPLIAIEELAVMFNVPGWMMAGLKVAYGWGEGKELTAADFEQSRDAWLSGPMTREGR